MGRADLHIHSIYSIDGTDSISELLEYAAYRDNLDVVAITDHDDIRGGLEACEEAGRFGIEAIPGVEVTTLDGHILALFVEKDIPPRRPLVETILRVGEMGGMCIAPHPNSPLANSLTQENIRRVASHPEASRFLVGMEVFTGCLLVNSQTAPLRSLANQLHLCEISASDAHVRELIGSGLVRFSGNAAADLQRALVNRQVTPIIRFNPTSAQVAVSWTRQTIAKRRNLFDYAREVRNYRANQKRNSKNS